MRLLLLCLMLLPALACAQTRDVNPGELALEVTLETSAEEIFQGEMVLVTIHGRYRRHITLEKLETPELDGFNWMQLGQDTWYETRERGQPIKNFRRRMALFPDRTGALTIPPFVHHLTLTDEGDDWFEIATRLGARLNRNGFAVEMMDLADAQAAVDAGLEGVILAGSRENLQRAGFIPVGEGAPAGASLWRRAGATMVAVLGALPIIAALIAALARTRRRAAAP